jgi:radical SAM enzyme (TIGR01210 family)
MNASPNRARAELDSSRPHAFFVERERAESGEVISVAAVFLTNRECPWRCIYCDLWKNTLTETVPLGAIPVQIDFALKEFWRDELHESPSDQSGARVTRPSNVKQIKLYNAGSFFDPKAIPLEDFPAIAERLSGFERVIVECHPALVGESAVRFRDLLNQSAIRNPQSAIDQNLVTSAATRLEVAMGLEIADDEILSRLNKRMTLAMFRRAAEFLVSNGIAVRAFIMVKPPFVRSEEEALLFARRSIDFAFDCGATVVSLIPARFGTAELQALARTGDFAPPELAILEAALDYGVSVRRGRVFADLWDLEKFADCASCFATRRERLDQISLEQVILPEVSCALCGCRSGRTRSNAFEQLAQDGVSAAGSTAIQ